MKLKECIRILAPSSNNGGNKRKTCCIWRKEKRQTFGDCGFRSGRKHKIGPLYEFQVPIANIRCFDGIGSIREKMEVQKAANDDQIKKLEGKEKSTSYFTSSFKKSLMRPFSHF
jgi:hypothetical protein